MDANVEEDQSLLAELAALGISDTQVDIKEEVVTEFEDIHVEFDEKDLEDQELLVNACIDSRETYELCKDLKMRNLDRIYSTQGACRIYRIYKNMFRKRI
jgi:hypothetical protein